MTLWPPRKRATNSVAGFSNTSRAEPACSILPLFITTTRSASASASSCPCVTWTNGMPSLRLQPLQFDAHAHAQERVERRQRLVEQQHARLGDERARQRDALLLAAGKLRRHALGVRRHRDEFEELHRPLAPRLLLDAAHLQRERDIVDAGEVRKQRVALKHHRRAALGRRQVGDVGRRRSECRPRRRSRGRRSCASVEVLPQPEGPSRQQ